MKTATSVAVSLCVVVFSSCSTVGMAIARAEPPMKTTCAKAQAFFAGHGTTEVQMKEGARELAGRRLLWRVRVTDVGRPSVYEHPEATASDFELHAECADSPGRLQLTAEFHTANVATAASPSDLDSLRKGDVVELEGLFEDYVPYVMWRGRLGSVVVRGIGLRRANEQDSGLSTRGTVLDTPEAFVEARRVQ